MVLLNQLRILSLAPVTTATQRDLARDVDITTNHCPFRVCCVLRAESIIRHVDPGQRLLSEPILAWSWLPAIGAHPRRRPPRRRSRRTPASARSPTRISRVFSSEIPIR